AFWLTARSEAIHLLMRKGLSVPPFAYGMQLTLRTIMVGKAAGGHDRCRDSSEGSHVCSRLPGKRSACVDAARFLSGCRSNDLCGCIGRASRSGATQVQIGRRSDPYHVG